MRAIENFLRAIDDHWVASNVRIRLHVIGSAALMLQADYERGTTDSDLLETAELDDDTKSRLRRLAGRNSRLHVRHGMYLQIVHGAIPFLPQQPNWRPVKQLENLVHFEVVALDVVDVVVSKLKRFDARDAVDIRAMINQGLVSHGDLVARFNQAVEWFKFDARAEDLPRYCKNLNRVERDLLGVVETEFDLTWIR